MTNHDKAQRFRALHTTPALRLANCWDAASAAVIASAGAPAIATSSAGVAWSLGYADGDTIDRETALAAIARIVRAVSIPVTADIESGFGEQPKDVTETLAAVAEAGAVGVNIEDSIAESAASLRPVSDQAERIAAAREGGGDGVFINARTDIYLAGIGDEDTRFDATVARARAYAEAGADGIFVPGVSDPATIAALAAAIRLPLNVLAGSSSPAPSELDRLGAARISLGSNVAAAAYEVARAATVDLLEGDSYGAVAGGIGYGTMQGLFTED
ncbi:isocitrate lyase/PEP mutase family protein [Glycomyces buryatensis]|uniref:Isocitrate lyase/phosphoenolpyruvate mutase family protein n=1 Tax=Glycomyces buryatensis TaxID=2570927 RepID=A0A4S8QI36_9ACTN|nr:isocitrate lyase/phosphoenolpyruvate mutase family protein [Glycomyces buryatensis]THV43411.1 isocitrate lyase/phosphoenolpyruvate mutase family protein [Glycomyces buryatensis]